VVIDLSEKKEKNSFKKIEQKCFKKIERDKNTSLKNVVTDFDNKEIKEKKEKEENKEKEEKGDKEENEENEEKEKNKTKHRVNMGDNYITIQSNNFHDKGSIIEVKLPNPYLDIDRPERNKTIEYRIKSKFKSAFADYKNHSLTNDGTNLKNKNRFKFINSNKYNNNIHFTRTQDIMKSQFK
jgi:hypothetical protein